MARAAETVLQALQLPATFEVLVLGLHVEVDHRVNHVLELLGTGEVAALGDLTDRDNDVTRLLGPARQLLEHSLRSLGVGVPILVEAVIHALQGVDDEHHPLPVAALAVEELIAVLQESGNVTLTTDDEVCTEAEPLGSEPDLEERLFRGVEADRVTGLFVSVSNLESSGSLTRTRCTRKDNGHGRSETAPTEDAVEPFDIRRELLTHELGNLDLGEFRAPRSFIREGDAHDVSAFVSE